MGGLALRYFSLLDKNILVISFWMIFGLFALRSLPGYRNSLKASKGYCLLSLDGYVEGAESSLKISAYAGGILMMESRM
jgi:hypothetical protein